MGLSHVEDISTGILYAYHQDEQGSTAYITGSDGVENCYIYDAFGNTLEKKEDIQNRILYTGQQYDQKTGQYYLRARYYNPAVGRFTQEDTYRGDGLNLYAYCGNNPVVYYDPSGCKGEIKGTCPPLDLAGYEENDNKDSVITINDDGTIKINDWTGYPDVPRPEGSFMLIEGDEYKEARDLANRTNASLHRNNPELDGLQIHEMHPVKFGGSPTDIDNKIALPPQSMHRMQHFGTRY